MPIDPRPTPAAGTGGAADLERANASALLERFREPGGMWAPHFDDVEQVTILTALERIAASSPERVAGGAGLPTVEKMAEALNETDKSARRPLMPWTELVSLSLNHPSGLGPQRLASDVVQYYRGRAAAILARLDPSRDRAANGRVDAGAVRAIKADLDVIERQVKATGSFDREETAAKKASPLPTTVEISLSHVTDAVKRIRGVLDAALDRAGEGSFQARNAAWMAEVMRDDPTDLAERVHRFTEEALELGQALGQTRDEVGQIADYVHGRPKGDPTQEVGGTETTLALLCTVAGIDKAAAGEAELARCSTPEIVAKIREKRSKRHGRGPLPGTYAPDFTPAPPSAPSGETP